MLFTLYLAMKFSSFSSSGTEYKWSRINQGKLPVCAFLAGHKWRKDEELPVKWSCTSSADICAHVSWLTGGLCQLKTMCYLDIYVTHVYVSFLSDQSSWMQDTHTDTSRSSPLKPAWEAASIRQLSVRWREAWNPGREGVSWLSGAKQRRAGRVRVISWSIWRREVGQDPVGVDAWRIWGSCKLFFPFCAADVSSLMEIHVYLCRVYSLLVVLLGLVYF